MKIAFFWFGIDGRYGAWKDGLYAALKLIEAEHEVRYYDVNEKTLKDVKDFNPDVVLFWESPVTNRGKDADMWFSVCALPYPKALLFAGGPLKAIDVKDFDLVFVESSINEEDCEREGIPYKRAFGVNTQIMKPMNLEKKYDGILAATFASWKRHELFAEALQSKGLAVGRVQEHDRNGYDRCVKLEVNVMDEVSPEELAKLYNQSHAAVNTAEYWGGGQRMTLEAMACSIPVIITADSPKNFEFVIESGGGIVSNPDKEDIQKKVEILKTLGKEYGQRGYEYVQSKWTEKHYADALLEGINSIRLYETNPLCKH